MNYARIVDGRVAELVVAYFTPEDVYGSPGLAPADVYGPGIPTEDDPNPADVVVVMAGSPLPAVVVIPAGTEVPIAQRFHPDIVAQLVPDPNNEAVPNGTYVDGVFGPVPAPPPPTVDEVNSIRNLYLSRAALAIAPLQDAVDLDEATPEEKALLKAWKTYRVALGRIDQQPGFPASVEWPVAPN